MTKVYLAKALWFKGKQWDCNCCFGLGLVGWWMLQILSSCEFVNSDKGVYTACSCYGRWAVLIWIEMKVLSIARYGGDCHFDSLQLGIAIAKYMLQARGESRFKKRCWTFLDVCCTGKLSLNAKHFFPIGESLFMSLCTFFFLQMLSFCTQNKLTSKVKISSFPN